MKIGDPYAETPRVGPVWEALTDIGRRDLVIDTLQGWQGGNDYRMVIAGVQEVHRDGRVVVMLSNSIPAAQRGSALRSFEAHLKAAVDQGIVISIQPRQDRNPPRQLRGVTVK